MILRFSLWHEIKSIKSMSPNISSQKIFLTMIKIFLCIGIAASALIEPGGEFFVSMKIIMLCGGILSMKLRQR